MPPSSVVVWPLWSSQHHARGMSMDQRQLPGFVHWGTASETLGHGLVAGSAPFQHGSTTNKPLLSQEAPVEGQHMTGRRGISAGFGRNEV